MNFLYPISFIVIFVFYLAYTVAPSRSESRILSLEGKVEGLLLEAKRWHQQESINQKHRESIEESIDKLTQQLKQLNSQRNNEKSSALSPSEVADKPLYPGGPVEIHVFKSGVKMWAQFLRKAQKDRFEKDNLWEKIDEPLITKVLMHAQKGDVFLDCGAALGYYSLLARRLSKDIQIHAFNPHPKFIYRMRQNMVLNGVNDITIHQLAIADKPMQGIKITSAGFGGRLQPNKNGTVNTTTLNEFIATLSDYKRILLVKADVEGFELKMLSAADKLFGVVQNWVIAIHQTREGCGKVLKQHGYTIIQEEPLRVEGEPNGVLVATLDKEKYFPEFDEEGSS